MATEYQKMMEHYSHGRDWGMRIGADAMRNLILAIPGIDEALAAKVRSIDVEAIKVKS